VKPEFLASRYSAKAASGEPKIAMQGSEQKHSGDVYNYNLLTDNLILPAQGWFSDLPAPEIRLLTGTFRFQFLGSESEIYPSGGLDSVCRTHDH
jgi:hypothetical protein